MTTPTPDALDLGDIEPGVAAGEPRPKDGSHPWAPSEFDRREHGLECDCLTCNPQR